MTIHLSIDYPPIPAELGEKIKGELQQDDILGDFGPGQSLWQHLFGGKRPDMTWCTIIAPEWFEGNYNGETSPAPLTAEGKQKLGKAVNTIFDAAGGPITVVCLKPGDKPASQKQLNISEFNGLLQQEGLPFGTLMILDRRLEDRPQ